MTVYFNKYRYSYILLKQLVKTDFKLRYQGSFLGYVWTLLRPMALFIILYVIFAKFLKVGEGIPHYPVYLLLGIVIWNYFAEVTSGSLGSIVGNGDLIRKINFPKYVIVLTGSFSALINLFINFIVIFMFMFINNVDFTIKILLAPILILELFVFSLSIAFILSALFVRFRDINYIWEIFMQGAFYATPILYPISLVPAVAAKIMILNPIAQIIQDLRSLMITQQTITIAQLYDGERARLIPLAVIALLGTFAFFYFKSKSDSFAEKV